MHSTLLRRWAAAAALVPLAACAGDAARTTLPPGDAPGGPLKPLSVLGVYELTISGLNTGQIRTTLTPVRTPGGARGTLTVFTTGLTLENTNSVLLADGPRGNGGQRYFTFTYRLRNAT
ncbi:MAG TPA: hypothetical protein VFJ82_15925, partial [Longimicrobium sp.]|nr:hypothetical protein [Longimicrobium sp.]